MAHSADEVKNDLSVLMWIHTFLSVAVVAVLMFFFGCKEIQEQQATLGPEVEAQSIIEALILAQGNATPWDIQKGEAVLYDYTQEVEGSPPSLFLQVSQQVLAIEDVKDQDGNYLFLQVTSVGTEFDPETGEETELSFSRQYDPQVYGVDPSLSIKEVRRHETHLETMLSSFQNQVVSEQSEILRETFHDLKVKQLRMAPPVNVSSQDNCGDVPNCELRVTRISYDKAEWTSESKFQKVSYEYDLSIDPPYSGLILRECLATQVKVENRKFFVRNCMNMRDFLYGN